MFKKAAQVALTFGLLLAGYAGYTRVFALVAARIQAAQVAPFKPFEARGSKTFREAIELAIRAFGRDHWSADPSLDMFRFYSADRGYWMYAKDYKREKDGKLLVFAPFALIWVSRDGKDLKTATSDKAFVLLDQPFDLVVKPGGAEMRVVNARLEGNVHLRDDKGTVGRDDDLRISGRGDEGLTYVEYDEAKQRITHDSYVTIEDGDMRVAGKDIEIVLRPKEVGPGKAASYSGAQTIFLRKDVHIIIKDVGRSGVLPGTAPAAPKQGARTPLDLRCDGLARFDLPKPRPILAPQAVGPPAPPLPTYAEFDRNVEVVRGRLGETPDRLLCDHLRLTFFPDDKIAAAPKPGANVQVQAVAQVKPAPAQPGDAVEENGGDSPLGGLALREAHATGHAVELISPSQGVRVRQCNQLIYKKRPGQKLGETDDETYLRTDLTQKLLVEKIEIAAEGPDKGKVTSVTQVRCVDATVFQNGAQSDQATIVARGPGILETRPALDKPVERTAVWNDQLEYTPVHTAEGQLRKRITLTDSPKFHDVASQTTLDARRMLVIYLRPKAQVPAGSVAASPKGRAGESTTESFEIETLVGLDDVHLNAPDRHLTADERLDAAFEPAPLRPAGAGPAAKPAQGGNGKFVVAGDPFAEEKPAAPAPMDPKDAGQKPSEPAVFVHARRVWANVLMTPSDEPSAGGTGSTKVAAANAGPGGLGGSGKSKGELQRVYLAGAVTFHQDPAPGESKGTDVSGEACWGMNEGDGLWQFFVYDQEPTPDKVFPTSRAARSEVMPLLPARVANKDMTIEGPTIGLDQVADKAWVVGPGKLVMMTERDLLSDQPPSASTNEPKKPVSRTVPTNGPERSREPAGAIAKGAADDKAKPPTKKVPVTITWTTEMDFYGQSTDPENRPAARAEFFSDPTEPPPLHHKGPIVTRAETDNGLLVCQTMKVYFDRPIKMAKLRPAPGVNDPKQGGEPEPKHEINSIECFDNVVAISRKVENFELVQQERVEGQTLVYNKVTGRFQVPGAGTVFYWNLKGTGPGAQPDAAPVEPGPPPPSRVITRTSSPARKKPDAKKAEPRRAEAAAKKAAGPAAPVRQLELTVVKFDQKMQGKFLPGKEGEREPRTADFFGNVEALHAPVADTKVKFDFDKPPLEYSHMTAQTMRLISEPPKATDPPKTPARTYMQAFDNAFVRREDATIQADKITYDSEKDLFWAYGYEGRQVTIRQSQGIGQTGNVTEGRAAYLIHRTGEAKLIDPQNFQLVDGKTGTRPTPDKPTTATPPVRPKRSRMPGRGSVERKTFNGK
ncbi:MAG: hypothetical protein P4L84_18450 [Isosphaeraceae bacterium]|nr:hypothetical protein [Isosphaeraceae bacterium]